ncbi:hypothetical protein VTK56DRAFT_8929 [Thermocarpiscus australiensis]
MSTSNASATMVTEPEQQQQQANNMGGELQAPPESSGNSNYQRLVERWSQTASAVKRATRRAFLSSPPGTSGPEPDREEFRQYWWGVFTQLLEFIAADPAIPAHLTSPPVTKFVVKLFDQPHRMCCPCSLPDVDPTITLENEDGVTKMDLVRGLRDYLYGETPPIIYTAVDDFTEESITMDTPLIYWSDWMSSSDTNESGETFSYYDDVPEVFLYCCRYSQFNEEAGSRYGQFWEEEGSGNDGEAGEGQSKTRGKSRRVA